MRDGVTILKDKVILKSTDVSPDFTALPSWLDPANADDQIIATIFSAMRKYAHSEITFVTADVHFQSKCDHLEIQFVDPPVTQS